MCEYKEVEMQMGGRAVFILSKPGVRRGQARDGGWRDLEGSLEGICGHSQGGKVSLGR